MVVTKKWVVISPMGVNGLEPLEGITESVSRVKHYMFFEMVHDVHTKLPNPY